MDKKTTALVSYITLIGWLIAFFTGKDVFCIVLGIIISIVPALSF